MEAQVSLTVAFSSSAFFGFEYIYSKLTYFPEGQQFTFFFFFIGLMKYF